MEDRIVMILSHGFLGRMLAVKHVRPSLSDVCDFGVAFCYQ